MTTTLTHINIRVTAKSLNAETYELYEKLVQPFTRPYRENMSMNLEKHTLGNEVSCKMHVYGRCSLDGHLLDELVTLMHLVPEAQVELVRGRGTPVEILVPHLSTTDEVRGYRLRLWECVQDADFHVMLNGKALRAAAPKEPVPLRRVS